MQLRPYQTGAIDRVREVFVRTRRVCLVAPTGSGKTVMASEVIKRTVDRGRRVLFLAHRKELIDQAHAKLAAFGVEAGVLMGKDRRRDDFLPVQVASTQTLIRRLDRLPSADLVVYDECHHAASTSSRDILAAYPDAFVLGLTATPWRSDRMGLGDLFGGLVVAATVRELMDLGNLVEYDAFAYDAPDLHKVKVTAGDFNQRDLGLACNTEVLVGSVVREYLAHARGRSAILFPVDVAHSEHLVAEFKRAGVRAEHLDCNTPKQRREALIAGLADGSVTILSSVGVLTEGFDCPSAEVCILARPTKSLTLHLQMIGRVLRPAVGKLRALIHDHAGNLMRHGFAEDDRDYSLTQTPKRVRELHTCPLCCALFGAIRPDGTCPKCGGLIAPPRDESAESSPREAKIAVEGKRISKSEIEAMRARLAGLGGRSDLSDRMVAKVMSSTRRDQAAEYLRLCAVAESRGWDPRWVAKEFRRVFGEYPNFEGHELDGVVPADRPFVPLAPRKSAA